MRRDSSKFRERFLRWKNGELVYEGGRAVPQYLDGKDNIMVHDAQNDVYYGPNTYLPEVEIRPKPYNYTKRSFNEQKLNYTEFDRPYHEISGMGALGLSRNKQTGKYCYRKNGLIVTECARVANDLSARMGRPTTGNAWTQAGMFGDSVLINGYDSVNAVRIPSSRWPTQIRDLAVRVRDLAAQHIISRNLPHINVRTGDIVGLSYKNSPYRFRATKETLRNTPNTHTGRILELPTRNGERMAYVIHNVGGKVMVEPFADMASGGRSVGVVNIIRPKENPNYHSYLTFGNGPNNLYFLWKRDELLRKIDEETPLQRPDPYLTDYVPNYADGKDSSPWSPLSVNAWRNGWAPAQYTGSPSQRKLLYNQSGDYYYGGKLADVTVTGRKPYRWVSANTPQLTVGDAVKGIHTAINPVLAWMSPSQYVGAIRDAMNGGNFFTSMMRGNSGLVTPQFEREHPWISLGLNFAGDVAGIGGVSKAIRSVTNKIGGAIETLRYGPLGKPRDITNPNRLDFVYHGRHTYRGEPENVLRNYSEHDVGLHVSPRRLTSESFTSPDDLTNPGFLYEGVDVNNRIPNVISNDLSIWIANSWDRALLRKNNQLNQIIDYFGLDRGLINRFAREHSYNPEQINKNFAEYLRSHGVKFDYDNAFEGGGILLPSRFISDPSDIWWSKKIHVTPLDTKRTAIGISYGVDGVPNGSLIPAEDIFTRYILQTPIISKPGLLKNSLPYE